MNNKPIPDCFSVLPAFCSWLRPQFFVEVCNTSAQMTQVCKSYLSSAEVLLMDTERYSVSELKTLVSPLDPDIRLGYAGDIFEHLPYLLPDAQRVMACLDLDSPGRLWKSSISRKIKNNPNTLVAWTVSHRAKWAGEWAAESMFENPKLFTRLYYPARVGSFNNGLWPRVLEIWGDSSMENKLGAAPAFDIQSLEDFSLKWQKVYNKKELSELQFRASLEVAKPHWLEHYQGAFLKQD